MTDIVDAKEALHRLSQSLSSVDAVAEILEREGLDDPARVLRHAHKNAGPVSDYLMALAYPAKSST